MFGTLDPSNTADSKQLLEFYQNKFLDMSRINQVHSQTNNRLTLKSQFSSGTWDETQLRLINKDVLKQFGQGSLNDLQAKYKDKLSMEQLQLSHRMNMQNTLSQTINREQ